MGERGTSEFGHAQVTQPTDLVELMARGELPPANLEGQAQVAVFTPQPPQPRRRFWRDVLVGAVLVVVTHVFFVQISVVRGLSMSPSLSDGDRLMVDRLSYSLADVSRFDVVILRYPRNPDVDFVKRVVGLPGDEIVLRHGILRVNGEAVPEEFAYVNDVHAWGTWIVPADSFFVLGDNRPVSCDSREFGMVKRSLLKGKVRAIFWPLDHFALL